MSETNYELSIKNFIKFHARQKNVERRGNDYSRLKAT